MSQGKSSVMASPRLAYALDQMSKNALADLVIDIVRGTVGIEASEAEVVANLQQFIDPVLVARKDKPVSLEKQMARHDHF